MRARFVVLASSLAVISTLAARPARAEAPEARGAALDTSKEGVALGFDLRRFQDDFGIGATVHSPTLARWFRVTLGGGVAWYPHATNANGTEAWEMFGHSRLVLEIGPTFQVGIPVRPYGFAGSQALYLPSSLSKTSVALGGVGGFGVELAFMSGAASGPVTYYMEIGGAGFGATADKLPTNPNIASGLLLGAGFRAYL